MGGLGSSGGLKECGWPSVTLRGRVGSKGGSSDLFAIIVDVVVVDNGCVGSTVVEWQVDVWIICAVGWRGRRDRDSSCYVLFMDVMLLLSTVYTTCLA